MNVWYTCMQKNKDQYMYTHVLDMYVVHGTYMTYLCTYNILTYIYIHVMQLLSVTVHVHVQQN